MSQNPTPPPSPMTPPPAAPAKERNVVGLIALIAGIVGFVFACIPGALIVGWILLPIAFILGIVALCLKGKSKWAGLVGLILSVVGAIVGALVFVFVIAAAFTNAVDDASGGETVVSEPSDASDEGEAPSDDKGTRENPVSFDATIENENWTVTLADYNGDANEQVVDGMFNDEPADGKTWITFVPSVTYHGDDSAMAAEVQFAYVAADGTVVDSLDVDSIAILDDGFDASAELYDGATETGTYALMVPEGGDGLLRITPGMLGDEVFVALP